MGTATRGLARAYAVGLTGISGEVVEVEAHLAAGTPAFAVTGLPDTAVREARDRIKAAIVNSRVEWPNRRITVGLSPASMPKHGTGYDLAMAVSLLAAAGQLPADPLASYLLVGELGLDGRIRSLPGVLPMVHTAARAGLRTVMVPAVHAAEAALVPEVRVYGVGTLAEAIALLRGEATVEPFVRPPAGADPAGDPPDRHVDGLDLADVVGQEIGRRALEVAAAGGHHLFLVGPPGAGKTLLAERLPGLLPPLDEVPLTAQPRSPRSPAHRAAPLTAQPRSRRSCRPQLWRPQPCRLVPAIAVPAIAVPAIAAPAMVVSGIAVLGVAVLGVAVGPASQVGPATGEAGNLKPPVRKCSVPRATAGRPGVPIPVAMLNWAGAPR
ncbi:MAG: magnesium chelatase domain-containing protein [Mycobacteriales bacterium]